MPRILLMMAKIRPTTETAGLTRAWTSTTEISSSPAAMPKMSKNGVGSFMGGLFSRLSCFGLVRYGRFEIGIVPHGTERLRAEILDEAALVG